MGVIPPGRSGLVMMCQRGKGGNRNMVLRIGGRSALGKTRWKGLACDRDSVEEDTP